MVETVNDNGCKRFLSNRQRRTFVASLKMISDRWDGWTLRALAIYCWEVDRRIGTQKPLGRIAVITRESESEHRNLWVGLLWLRFQSGSLEKVKLRCVNWPLYSLHIVYRITPQFSSVILIFFFRMSIRKDTKHAVCKWDRKEDVSSEDVFSSSPAGA